MVLRRGERLPDSDRRLPEEGTGHDINAGRCAQNKKCGKTCVNRQVRRMEIRSCKSRTLAVACLKC
jgi:hypothetical protein